MTAVALVPRADHVVYLQLCNEAQRVCRQIDGEVSLGSRHAAAVHVLHLVLSLE